MMITLKEYAIRNGRNIRGTRNKAYAGDFKTAQKMGRDWIIDENEPYVDQRVTDGKWVGYVRKRSYIKKGEKQEVHNPIQSE